MMSMMMTMTMLWTAMAVVHIAMGLESGVDDGRWLQQLFASAGGDGWYDTSYSQSSCNSGWMMTANVDPCSGGSSSSSWSRVSCSNGRVVGVYLSYCNLRGTLPELGSTGGAMSQLQSIYLQSNQLIGTLPASWSSLSSLQSINLYDNRLTGGYPSSWVNRLNSLGLQLQFNCLDNNGIPSSELSWWNSKSYGGSSLTPQSTTSCSIVLCAAGRYLLNGVCTQCPIGMYCPDNGNVSIPCPVGTYALMGQSSCTACSPGAFNPLTNQSKCTLCPAGSFTPFPGQTACTLCSPGTYNPNPGVNGSSCTIQCPPGTYSPSGSPRCLPCSPGTYSNASGAAGCDLCPIGMYAPDAGAVNCSVCVGSGATAPGATRCKSAEGSCGPGTFYNSSVGVCLSCAIGTYSLSTGAVDGCTACGPGTFVVSNATGSSTRDVCAACPAGSYSDTDRAFRCTLCPPGTYGTTVGANGVERCVACPAGTFNRGSGANATSSCAECSAGSYSLSGSAACIALPSGSYSVISGLSGPFGVLCAAGTYGPRSGASRAFDCLACPKGTFSSALGATSNATCTVCPAGTYGPTEGATSVAACAVCAAGTYSNRTGAASAAACEPCPAGSYSGSPGSTTCAAVPVGSYSSRTGLGSMLSATPCPTGTFGPSTGATSVTACLLCPAGTYNPSSGASSASSCILCPAGTNRSLPGASRVDQCVVCAAGTYAELPGSSQCTLCSPGTASPVVGSTSSADCTPCMAGYFASVHGLQRCLPCPIGAFSNSSGASSCVVCPVGSFNALVGSTVCSSCPVGTFANANGSAQCRTCPSGSYQPTLGSSSCLECGSELQSIPLPLDSVYSTIDVSGCSPLQVTIPLNYGSLATADVGRMLSPAVSVTRADGSALPDFLTAAVSGGGAYVLLSAVELPAVPLDGSGSSQVWSVAIRLVVRHSCLVATSAEGGGVWIGYVTVRVTQVPPRFAALSSSNAAGLAACPQFETTLLASLGSCSARVVLGAVVVSAVPDVTSSVSPPSAVSIQSTSAGGLLSVFGRAPTSGMASFTFVGVASLRGTNVTSDLVSIRVTSVADNTPSITASVTTARACPYVSVRFSGRSAVCGQTVFGARLANGSALPGFLSVYADSGGVVVVSGVLPSSTTSIDIVGTATLVDPSGNQQRNVVMLSSVITVVRGVPPDVTTLAAQWSVGGSVYDVLGSAGNLTIVDNKSVVAPSAVVWRSVTVYYGLAMSVSAALSGVDSGCASVGLWASTQPPTSASQVASGSGLPQWLRSSSTSDSSSRLTVSGAPPTSDAVGTVYTVCVFALNGVGNPCLCLEATLAVSLLITVDAGNQSVAAYRVLTPAPVVTAKVFVPASLPAPALLVCPDSTTGAGSLAFCQYSASTRSLGAFGTADGVASMLGGVRLAVATGPSSSLAWLGQYNVTVSVSDATNPVPVTVGVQLSLMQRYGGIEAVGGVAPPVLRATVGIMAHVPLAELLNAASADVVSSGYVHFALLQQLPAKFGSSLVISGSYLEGTTPLSTVGNWSMGVLATDTRTSLAVTISGIRLEVTTPRSPNATVATLTRQVLHSGDTAVISLPPGTFEDPEAASVGDTSQLTYVATYFSGTEPSVVAGSSGGSGAPLPSWMIFDVGSMQFSLQPTLDCVGEHFIRITATSRYGEWTGNASVVQHVTVDYSMRDLLKSLYDTLRYSATAFSLAALLFAYRVHVRNVALYGRCLRRGGTPTELLRGEPLELVAAAPDIALVRVRKLQPDYHDGFSDNNQPPPRSEPSEPSSMFESEPSSTPWFTAPWAKCVLPKMLAVRLRAVDCEFAESTSDGGAIRGVPWLQRRVTGSTATISIDVDLLRQCVTYGEVESSDVYMVEVEAAGWWSRGFVLDAFELRMEELLKGTAMMHLDNERIVNGRRRSRGATVRDQLRSSDSPSPSVFEAAAAEVPSTCGEWHGDDMNEEEAPDGAGSTAAFGHGGESTLLMYAAVGDDDVTLDHHHFGVWCGGNGGSAETELRRLRSESANPLTAFL